MYRYFYKLEYIIFYYYDEKIKEKVEEIIPLGYYSSKKKTLEKIDELKERPGFKEYGIENFHITKERVAIENNIEKKTVSKLYRLSYEYYTFNEKQEQSNFIYYFSPNLTIKETNKLKTKLMKKEKYQHKEYKKYFDFEKDDYYIGDGFYIDEIYIDECISLFSDGFDPEPTDLEKSLVKEGR